MNTIFSVFLRHFRASSLFITPIFLGHLIYYGIQVGLDPLSWIMLPIFIILSLLLLVTLEFTLSTSMFWVTDGLGINFLRMQFQQLSRWPNFVYQSLTRKILTFAIPILLIGSAPVHFLFDHSQYITMLYLIGALFFAIFILAKLWKLGLRRYDSASS